MALLGLMTLCTIVWLPYAPEYVDKPFREARGFVYVYKCQTFDLLGDLTEVHWSTAY